MVKLDKTFPNKILVKEIPEENIELFIKSLLLNAWMDHDIPSEARTVKEDKKLTVEMLPKTFDIDAVVKDTLRKGILILERIGPIMFNMRLWVCSAKQQYTLDIDKFSYESDGHSLSTTIDKTIKDLEIV